MSDDARPIEVVAAGHVCLDVIPSFPAGSALPPPGGLGEVGPATVSTGGSVSNTGLALHRLGVGARLVGRVGATAGGDPDPFGLEVRRLFDAAGPGLSAGLVPAPGEATSYTVVVSPPGEDRRFLHCPGVNATFTAADVPDAALLGVGGRGDGADAGPGVFHFGYPPIMRAMCDGDGRELRTLFDRAKAAGLTASLDTCGIDPSSDAGRLDWPALLGNVLPAVDLFLPSWDEVRFMLGRPAGDPSVEPPSGDLADTADALLALGAAVVGLKLGEHGMYLKSSADPARLRAANLPPAWSGVEHHAPTFVVDVAGATGAGDCTIAGLLAAVVRGKPPAVALDWATAAGAMSVTRPDATSGVRPLADVERFLASSPERRPAIEL